MYRLLLKKEKKKRFFFLKDKQTEDTHKIKLKSHSTALIDQAQVQVETAVVRSRRPISPCPSSRVAPRCGIPPPRYNHLDDQTRTAHQRDAHHTHLALNLSVLQTVTRGQENCREVTPLKEKKEKKRKNLR